MFIERSYLERDKLSDHDLERLRAALADEVERYAYAIRNYPPDRMDQYGRPYLAKLREKVTVVDTLILSRANQRLQN